MGNIEFEKSTAYQLIDIVEYIHKSIVIRSIFDKKTGTVSVSSFDTGEISAARISPFDNLIQVIEGIAEVLIDNNSTHLGTGQFLIIPAHSINKIKANVRFKIVSTVIKSGYEDLHL